MYVHQTKRSIVLHSAVIRRVSLFNLNRESFAPKSKNPSALVSIVIGFAVRILTLMNSNDSRQPSLGRRPLLLYVALSRRNAKHWTQETPIMVSRYCSDSMVEDLYSVR